MRRPWDHPHFQVTQLADLKLHRESRMGTDVISNDPDEILGQLDSLLLGPALELSLSAVQFGRMEA
jgi:hypothetical protein